MWEEFGEAMEKDKVRLEEILAKGLMTQEENVALRLHCIWRGQGTADLHRGYSFVVEGIFQGTPESHPHRFQTGSRTAGLGGELSH